MERCRIFGDAPTSHRLARFLIAGAMTLALAVPSLRADDEDDEPTVPGLLTQFTVGATTVERFDTGLNYDWGKASPDPRLPAGPFLGSWRSLLMTKQTAKYRFHAWLHGAVTVKVGGRTVLSDERKTAGWVSGAEVEIKPGEHDFDVSFRSRADGGTMRVFWSSDKFSLEPIPEHMLLRDDARPEIDVSERGRRDFVRHRCNRCHRRENDTLSPPGPDLALLGGALDPAWIAAKLERGTADGGAAFMPSFGFDRDEAVSIASFLHSTAKAPTLDALPALKPADAATHVKAGEVLFRTVGCAGCHWPRDPVREDGVPLPKRPALNATDRFELQPLPGGDLTRLGGKRSREWIFTWLAHPERLNADHRMPVFKLSDAERAQVAIALSEWKPDEKAKTALVAIPEDQLSDAPRIARGRHLVEAARCAACHRIPGVESPKPAGDLRTYAADWANACTQEAADRKGWRPGFPNLFEDAVKIYVRDYAAATRPPAPDLAGRDLLERNNCLGCHDRGTQKGMSKWAAELIRGNEALRGQSEGLIPPSLTAVGDKLRDAALAEAVSGEQPKPRLPWLKIRMPKFAHTPEEKAALVASLRAADRIPEAAPGAVTIESPPSPLAAEALLLGRQLVGPTGFSCIACHEIGPYKPKNVALGTRGSDLMAMAGRMRKEYYLRWSRSPARIVPGMEMPSYQKPVAGVLNESIDAQLLALWDAVNDPRFTPPTNPTAVEQLLLVKEGDAPRIVRDVFTTPREFGAASVPRAFAVGFHNGHNLLFDLDSFTLRQWTFGDFARQRTEGKSWYWDMAGTPILRAASPESDFVLRRIGDGELLAPHLTQSSVGRLTLYQTAQQRVGLSYVVRWKLPKSDEIVSLDVGETLAPVPAVGDSPAGVDRILQAGPVPEGYELLLATHQATDALGGGTIRRTTDPDVAWVASPPTATPLAHGVIRKLAPFKSATDAREVSLGLRYDADLTSKRLPTPQRPVLTASREAIGTVPGFVGRRLPIETSIMPTALTWTKQGTLAFTSLKGHVGLVKDVDGDGLEETLSIFEEGLAAPYGLLADEKGLFVAHKPEVLRLIDRDGDGRADFRSVYATGWGYSDNYHDWTCGFARDATGNLFVGLGSDYAQPDRRKESALWRGKVLRISPQGKVTPIAAAFRYPTGLALDGEGRLFVTDNQGVQNTFNELNHVVEGKSYGVPSRFEERPDAPETPPAVQIPHPWTRSVNGIAFLPRTPAGAKLPPDHPAVLFAGHGIGCEYDTRFLVRFTVQQVGDVVQGAVYPFSLPEQGAGRSNFTGPLSIGISPEGHIYIGSIHDSGWLGGLNTGDIVQLRPKGSLPNGIVEVRAAPRGFEVTFVRPIDAARGADVTNYTLSGYTRRWKGAYATPDSGRHTANVDVATVSDDGRRVLLASDEIREGHVYELNVGQLTNDATPLFPATAHYTLHRIPAK